MGRGWTIAAGLLIASTAHADDAGPPGATGPRPPDELAQSYVVIARDAAAAGTCDVVRDLGAQIQALDPALHARVFVTDPVIAPCLRAGPPPPAPTPPPALAPPAQTLSPPGLPRVTPPEDDDTPPARPPIALPRTTPAVAASLDRPATPELSGGRLLGEVLLGGLAGTGGLFVGGLIGAGLCSDDGGDFSCLGSVLIGAYIGGVLAVPLGVYAVGASGDQDGSLGSAILGSVLGSAVGFGSLLIGEELGVALLITGPPIGAMIGFNSSRRWDRAPTPKGTALLSLRDGELALGLPLVTRGADATGAAVTTLTLAGGSF